MQNGDMISVLQNEIRKLAADNEILKALASTPFESVVLGPGQILWITGAQPNTNGMRSMIEMLGKRGITGVIFTPPGTKLEIMTDDLLEKIGLRRMNEDELHRHATKIEDAETGQEILRDALPTETDEDFRSRMSAHRPPPFRPEVIR